MLNFIIITVGLIATTIFIIRRRDHWQYHETIGGTLFISGFIALIIGAPLGLILYLLRYPAAWVTQNWDWLAGGAMFIFFITAVIQSLSWHYHGNTAKRWFLGAIVSAGLLAVLLGLIFEWRLSALHQEIQALSRSFLLYYLYGCIVGIIFFPAQLGRVLYKVWHGRDVEITHTRKPREQHQYTTIGYSCGNCGRSLSGSLSQCPYCGVRFGGTREQYLPGSPSPKSTTTKTRNTTPMAGFAFLILLLLNMLYGLSLFEIRNWLNWSETESLLYLLCGPVTNLIIVIIAISLLKRYENVRGHIRTESYY